MGTHHDMTWEIAMGLMLTPQDSPAARATHVLWPWPAFALPGQEGREGTKPGRGARGALAVYF